MGAEMTLFVYVMDRPGGGSSHAAWDAQDQPKKEVLSLMPVHGEKLRSKFKVPRLVSPTPELGPEPLGPTPLPSPWRTSRGQRGSFLGRQGGRGAQRHLGVPSSLCPAWSLLEVGPEGE